MTNAANKNGFLSNDWEPWKSRTTLEIATKLQGNVIWLAVIFLVAFMPTAIESGFYGLSPEILGTFYDVLDLTDGFAFIVSVCMGMICFLQVFIVTDRLQRDAKKQG